jgi:DNA-directed RNA polymerase subunit beta
MEFVAERLKRRSRPLRHHRQGRARSSSPRTSASPPATPASSEQTGTTHISVPEDFLVGPSYARNIVDPDTGEIIAKANDELTEALLKKLRAAGVQELQCDLHQRTRPGRLHLADAAQDETADEFAARVAIYRMMRPGEPPTEDAVQALFQRLFYNPDTYDLSRVGRMKFNAKCGPRPSPPGRWCWPTRTSWSVVKILVELRNGRGEVDDIDHLGNRRVRCVGELACPIRYRIGLVRMRTHGPRAHELPGEKISFDAARPW